jgi:hypothetical protein
MNDAAADTPAGPPLFRRVRTRVELSSHSYGYVLLLIGVSFVFAATAPDADWATSVLVLLQSATLVVALWAAGLAAAGAWHNVLFLLLAVALAITGLIWEGPGITAALSILSGLITVAIVVVIAHTVVTKGEVNRQSITGAICVYLLLGMIFVFVYGVMAALGDGPFFAQGTDGTRALRVYFSYVTLATLGYGDYTAAGNLGHALAVVEALLGQLYLVTVVALLVARMRPARARD